MTQWSANGDNAASAPKVMAQYLDVGSGKAAKAANNTALYANVTHNAFISHETVGVFGVTPAKMANTSSEGPKATSPGWNIRRAGQGPVVSVTATGGTGFANGETATISGGTSNATITLTSNATGNLASGAVSSGGLFTNTGEASVAFNREKHLTGITVGGTPTGYSNTDTIVASNGSVNATATVITNSSGGFVTANVTITNVGLWPNATTNSQVTFVVLANTGANSAGSGATFAAGLANSSGGTVTPTLGGRAGRVHYECFAESSSLQSSSQTLP